MFLADMGCKYLRMSFAPIRLFQNIPKDTFSLQVSRPDSSGQVDTGQDHLNFVDNRNLETQNQLITKRGSLFKKEKVLSSNPHWFLHVHRAHFFASTPLTNSVNRQTAFESHVKQLSFRSAFKSCQSYTYKIQPSKGLLTISLS